MITDQQRQARKLGIGGSDMPIIMGVSSYKTPCQLYLEKTGQLPIDDKVTSLQYWGNKLESIILEEFSTRNNVSVETPGTIIHPSYDFLRGNIDGFIPSMNAVLEIKTASSFISSQWGENGSADIPIQYIVQVAHYCAITNADCAYIAVLIGGNDYREFKYVRNLEIETTIIEEAKKFWQCVQTRTPPEFMNQADVRLMFPQHHPEKAKTINNDIEKSLIELSKTRCQINDLSHVEEQYKFNIMKFMQDSECLVNRNGMPVVSWKSNKRGSRVFSIKNEDQLSKLLCSQEDNTASNTYV